MSETTVRADGPIFDGRASLAARDFAKDLEQKLGQKAAEMVRAKMAGEFKVDEGKYVASIHVDQDDAYTYVHDLSAFVYGPWLEGDGSRNDMSRFKGYHTMREISSEVSKLAQDFAEEEIKPYLERMN